MTSSPAREVSAREVLHATRERIAQVNPTLNAIVTMNDRAEAEAEAVDAALARGEAPGLLCGLPVGIKDVTPVAGLRTTYGSPLFADHVPAEDAAVVTRLRRAGAVIIGKTNCPEFAAGGNTFNQVFGATRNPWDPVEERRRIHRRRRRGAGHRHDRAGRGHRPGRLAADPGVVLRRGRAAPVGGAGADVADRLAVGHAAGERSDGPDARLTSR